MFNSDQNNYMDSLNKMKPEELCYCGWNRLGDCPNSKPFNGKRGYGVCIYGESAADKLNDIATQKAKS